MVETLPSNVTVSPASYLALLTVMLAVGGVAPTTMRWVATFCFSPSLTVRVTEYAVKSPELVYTAVGLASVDVMPLPSSHC